MLIGHYGVGFAGKKVDSRPSLGTLFLAAQFVDLLWPVFLLIGLEKVQIDPGNTAMTPLNFTYYPYSHSLFSVLIWGVVFGAVYYLIKKNLRSSLLLGSLVVSHWFLDLLVHRADLPLVPWSGLKVGLGLWNNVFLSLFIETLIFGVGAILYIRATHSYNRIGSIGLWSLLVILLMIYVMNVFGTPPSSVNALAFAGLSQWIIVPWGYWIDRNRTSEPMPVTGQASAFAGS